MRVFIIQVAFEIEIAAGAALPSGGGLSCPPSYVSIRKQFSSETHAEQPEGKRQSKERNTSDLES